MHRIDIVDLIGHQSARATVEGFRCTDAEGAVLSMQS